MRRTLVAVIIGTAILASDGLQLRLNTEALAGGGRDGGRDGSDRQDGDQERKYKLSDIVPLAAGAAIRGLANLNQDVVDAGSYNMAIGPINKQGFQGTGPIGNDGGVGGNSGGGNATAGGWGGEKP